MRHIGNLPTEEQASVFEDFMLASEIRVKVDPEDGEWAVWVIEEDQFDEARKLLAQFREEPDNSRYNSRYNSHSATARQIRKEEKKAAEQFKKNQIDVRTRWKSNRSGLRAGPATKSLIGISIVVGLITGLTFEMKGLYLWLTFTDFRQVVPGTPTFGLEGILSGQVWRVVTPIFLHLGPMHILFNMMWLYHLGSQIESRLGPLKYLLLVFVIAAISNYAQFAWTLYGPVHKLSGGGGMSGVVYGLFGYIWMKVVFEPQERYILTRQEVSLMIIWLFLCMTGMIGPIGNAAHLVGLLTGMGFGYWKTFLRRYLH